MLGAERDGYAIPNSDYTGKYTEIPIYYWDKNKTNVWRNSTLNINILNGTYLNTLGSTWSSKIATHTWQVGGVTYANMYLSTGTPKTTYDFEVGANSANVTYNAKVAIMYLSDYIYGASPSYWEIRGDGTNNWLYLESSENILCPRLDSSKNIFTLSSDSAIQGSNPNKATRPTIYLNSDVKLLSGTGTASDPYRIA